MKVLISNREQDGNKTVVVTAEGKETVLRPGEGQEFELDGELNLKAGEMPEGTSQGYSNRRTA